MSEFYHSTTHGRIRLSFTGRRLLANLRAAIETGIAARDWHVNADAISRARGDLAVYMSKLEERPEVRGFAPGTPRFISFAIDFAEIEARAHAARSMLRDYDKLREAVDVAWKNIPESCVPLRGPGGPPGVHKHRLATAISNMHEKLAEAERLNDNLEAALKYTSDDLRQAREQIADLQATVRTLRALS